MGGADGENCCLFRQDVFGRGPSPGEQTCNELADGVTAVSPAIAQYRCHESGGRRCQESLKCADNESKWLAFDMNNK